MKQLKHGSKLIFLVSDLLDEMVDISRDIKEVEEEISNMASQAEKSRAVLSDGEMQEFAASFV